MRTVPSHGTLLFGFIAAFATLSLGDAHAQYNPVGAHGAPLGSGAGFGSGSPSAMGSYTTSIQVDVPSARGNVDVPLSVVYSGDSGVGALGAGWDIPLSYIRRSVSVSRRKPSANSEDHAPARLVMSLGGGSTVMVPTGEPNRYQPFAASAPMELHGPFASGTPSNPRTYWLAYDQSGRTYRFLDEPRIDDSDVWYLVEVRDSTLNRVELIYDVDTGDGSAFPELSLSELAYSHAADTDCPQFRVALNYSPPGGEAVEDAPGLSLSAGNGAVTQRRRLVESIEVLSYTSGSCGLGHKTVRTYRFGYESARGTDQWRLDRVDMCGVEVDCSAEGARSIPVARYEYGNIATEVDGHDRVSYAPDSSITLPIGTPGAFSSSKAFGSPTTFYRTRHLVADFTGDGLSDYVSDGVLYVNRTTASGTEFTSAGGIFSASELDFEVELPESTAQQRLHQTIHQRNTVTESSRVVDFNGDGRMD